MKNTLKLFVATLFASTLVLTACGGKKECENKEEAAPATTEVAPAAAPTADSAASAAPATTK